MRLLFITHPYPNYVPDLLLHGLRKLLGDRVVDYPRKDCLYEGFLGTGVADESQLLKNWFPEDTGVDRTDIPTKILSGYFKYIIVDLRAAQSFYSVYGGKTIAATVVIIDGEDSPQRIPPGNYIVCQRETDGSDYSIPMPMALPQEVFELITSFDNPEKSYSIGFLGSVSDLCDERLVLLEQLAKRYPDALLKATAVPSNNDPLPKGRLGKLDYYASLQRCRFVLSLKGAGYDTFRFWENSACKAVHLSQRMPLYIPNDFIDGKDILRFSDIDELIRKIEAVLEGQVSEGEMIATCRERLCRYHLTDKRAEYLLRKLKALTG